MSNSRRYEILLPLKFNDGEPVPWTLIGEASSVGAARSGKVHWKAALFVARDGRSFLESRCK